MAAVGGVGGALPGATAGTRRGPVAVEFEQCFTRLFGGGEARLTLTGLGGAAEGNGAANGNGVAHDFDDIGIDITVRPPGKSKLPSAFSASAWNAPRLNGSACLRSRQSNHPMVQPATKAGARKAVLIEAQSATPSTTPATRNRVAPSWSGFRKRM